MIVSVCVSLYIRVSYNSASATSAPPFAENKNRPAPIANETTYISETSETDAEGYGVLQFDIENVGNVIVGTARITAGRGYTAKHVPLPVCAAFPSPDIIGDTCRT